MPPTLIELKDLHSLQREVFGPVLHVLRYQRRELPQLLERINALGYGLTMGLHTRIDETMEQVVQAAHVGNLYVNRNMVGAVVGVQPLGAKACRAPAPRQGTAVFAAPAANRRCAAAAAEPVATAIGPGAARAVSLLFSGQQESTPADGLGTSPIGWLGQLARR